MGPVGPRLGLVGQSAGLRQTLRGNWA